MLLDDLGLEGTVAVTRCLQIEAAGRTFHGLAGRAILPIRCSFGGKVGIQLGLHGGFGKLLD